MSIKSYESRGIGFVSLRAVGVASVVALVGLSLFAASPASATTSADCNAGNTVDANAATPGTQADIQTLLTADASVVCLIGNFSIAASLTVSGDVTFYGDPAATLTSTGTDSIITDANTDSITVQNLTLTGGHASGAKSGGAINGVSVTAIDSTFENNTSNLFGGAIFGTTGVDVESSSFVNNSATDDGGAFTSAASATADDSTFSDNSGGAMWVSDVATVTGSTFDHNTAPDGASALVAGFGTTIANSTFIDNSATTTGSAGGTPGAVFFNGGSVTQSTFLDNSTPEPASGEAISTDSSVTLLGNIFASSTPTHEQLSTLGAHGVFTDGGGNVFSTSLATETFLTAPSPTSKFGASVASLFVSAALGNNGGATQTVAIGPGSPAIGAVTTGSLPTDQRREPRATPADAGAFEFTAPTTTPTTPTTPTLPATGTDPSGLVGLASALLVAGALAFGLRRRLSGRGGLRG